MWPHLSADETHSSPKFPEFSTVGDGGLTDVVGFACKIHGSDRRDLQQRRDGVADEQLPVPDVARQHGVGGVSGLLPDLPGGDPQP